MRNQAWQRASRDDEPEAVTFVEVQKRGFTDCLLVDSSSSIIDERMFKERRNRGKKHLGTRETSEREFSGSLWKLLRQTIGSSRVASSNFHRALMEELGAGRR